MLLSAAPGNFVLHPEHTGDDVLMKISADNRQWLKYVLYSLLFLLTPILSSPDLGGGQMWHVQGFRQSFTAYALLLLFFYAQLLYFLPCLLFRKKLILFWLCMLVCFAAFVLLPMELFPMRFGPHGEHGMPHHEHHEPHHHGPHMLLFGLTRYALQFLAAGFFAYSVALNMRLEKVEKARVEAELSYLKAQINPHFLFNTLNSIYSLSIQKSDEAPDAVVRLSGMMRYMLSEASKEIVPLRSELDYIGNYIALQQIRLGSETHFSFVQEGSPEGKQIAPMLLIAFIENAFKYGVNPDEGGDIFIKLSISDYDIRLFVRNKKVNLRPAEIGGTGIDNTRKRLNALYPEKHILDIRDSADQFEVVLTLSLS